MREQSGFLQALILFLIALLLAGTSYHFRYEADESPVEIPVSESVDRVKPEVTPEENPAFDDINDIINKQENKDNSNENSSMSYSLVDRTHDFLPTPIYLCEYGGKIVINITVDGNGIVTDAYVNSSSSSTNGCLIDHALEYAKASQFSSDPSKPSQLGSISFLFRGKH